MPIPKKSKLQKTVSSSHPNQGMIISSNKPFSRMALVGVVTLCAIIILAFFLISSEKFVGKAAEFNSIPENNAGIFISNRQEVLGRPFVIPIKANIPAPSVAVRFTLQYPLSLTPDCTGIFRVLDNKFVTAGQDLSIIREKRCEEGVIEFEYGGICANAACSNAIRGEDVVVAEISFTAQELGPKTLKFTSFSILDLQDSTRNLVTKTVDGGIVIVAPSASSSSGGRGCTSNWVCPSAWSTCSATLQQTRTCSDNNNCNPSQRTKVETRRCAECQESWVCTEWNSCQKGKQTRNCIDENACSTTKLQPALQKNCQQQVAPGPSPTRIESQLPPAAVQKSEQKWPSTATQESEQTLPDTSSQRLEQPRVLTRIFSRDNNVMVIISSAAGVLIVGLLILFLVLKTKHPKTIYNFDELKVWVRQERQQGTSVNDIKTILRQRTGWNEQEISQVFDDVRGE